MNTKAHESRLIIFVKAPRPGFVKTRLAATVGADTAAESYAALVETLLTRLASHHAVELKFTPADAHPEIAPWLQPEWTASPQTEGDLTDRLIGAFDDAFRAGAKRVVIIGSDCPYITLEDIESAFTHLADHDAVLGPATDGGYWLVGLNQHRPALFQNINWSTESVLAETLAIAQSHSLRVSQLRELTDVDTLPDLLRFHEWRQPQISLPPAS